MLSRDILSLLEGHDDEMRDYGLLRLPRLEGLMLVLALGPLGWYRVAAA